MLHGPGIVGRTTPAARRSLRNIRRRVYVTVNVMWPGRLMRNDIPVVGHVMPASVQCFRVSKDAGHDSLLLLARG